MSERQRRRLGRPFERGSTVSLGFVVLAAVVSALAAPSCLERRDESKANDEVARCTSCHGDANRSGDYLRRAAPPIDLMQQRTSAYPGVGAHDIHLNASSTHAAIACNECHIIPDSVNSPGHADDGAPAEVTFGTLAKTDNLHPVYDPTTRTCQSSYCHGKAWAIWTEPRDSAQACGTCHGLPPEAPHPQSDRCYACHAEVVDENMHIIAPERHVDGVKDYVAGDCKICHGSDDNAAPPLDTLGNSNISAIGVGAHQVHLNGGANGRKLACNECHVVPDKVEDPTHVDGLPAELTFTGVARSMAHSPTWNESRATCAGTYCHSPSPTETRESPRWNQEKQLNCASCHGLPPALPHPQSDNCVSCHSDVVASDNRTIIDKNQHVNGVVNVSVDNACSNCHGDPSANPAPPFDLAGNSKTTAPGVGAHQTHLLGTNRSRAVPCNECHLVPERVLAEGHLDSAAPAELTFSGAAVAFGATPKYVNGSCQSTSCHGAVFSDGDPSGGTNTTPSWTRVDGSQATCGSCHGVPPPPPHPNPGNPCHNCHQNMAADDVTFTHPELHVDGIVTFQVP